MIEKREANKCSISFTEEKLNKQERYFLSIRYILFPEAESIVPPHVQHCLMQAADALCNPPSAAAAARVRLMHFATTQNKHNRYALEGRLFHQFGRTAADPYGVSSPPGPAWLMDELFG
jgi:hypothetical protein